MKNHTDAIVPRKTGLGTDPRWIGGFVRFGEVIAILLTVIVVMSLPSWAFDEGNFQQLETDHFLVRGDVRPSEIQETARMLEEIYTLVAGTFPRMTVHVPFPIEVLYFAERGDFDTVTSALVDRSQYKSDLELPYGHIRLYPDKARILVTRSLFAKYVPELFGGITSVLLHYAIESQPLWLEIGLPGLLNLTIKNEDVFMIGKLKKETVALLRSRDLIPVAHFLRLQANSSTYKYDESYRELFATQAVFFINYLLYADQKRHQLSFLSYIDQLIGGANKNEAFLSAFPEGTIALQASLRQYLMGTAIPYTIIKRAEITLPELGQATAATRVEMNTSFGDEYFRQGQIVRAEQYFSRGLANDSNSLFNHLGMARILYSQSQQEDFEQLLAWLIEQSKGNYPVQRSLAYFLAEIPAKQKVALTLLAQNSDAIAQDICTLKYAANLAIKLDDYEASTTFLNRFLGYFPEHVTWPEKYLSILERNKDYERAAAFVLQGLTRDPESKQHYRDVLRLIEYLADTDIRASFLLRLHKLLPSDLTVIQKLAELYEQIGNVHAAQAYYQKGLELAPDNTSFKTKLDELLIRISQTPTPESPAE